MKVEIPNHLLVKVSGLVSRGIKAAEINEDGILIFTLTDGTKIELGSVKGDPGPRGESGVYVGTGEMPEDCNVQIDPSGEAFEFIQPPKTASVGQALLVKSVDENGKPTEWETGEVQAGSGGTSDHQKLSNRDAAAQHPMKAITGLEAALAGKQPTGNYLTNEALTGAVDDALAQAKASGEFDGADGKTAYQYAQDGGYTGTEAEFAEKLAAEIPAIDNSLSKAGQAADAAKVGEEISSLSGKIEEIPSGKDGITPTIGENGNWYLGDTDTGKPSRGETGPAGADGKDGATGAAGADGYTPVKGTDYWTADDQQSIVADVLAALPTWEGGSY